MSKIDPVINRGLIIVYDGECPFCRSYVQLYRLKNIVGRVHLIDARTSHPFIDEIRARHLDLNQGMVVHFENQFFHGADAMHVLALLGSNDTVFNSISRILFRHPRMARAIYPVLVRGRGVVLRLLGRHLIGEA